MDSNIDKLIEKLKQANAIIQTEEITNTYFFDGKLQLGYPDIDTWTEFNGRNLLNHQADFNVSLALMHDEIIRQLESYNKLERVTYLQKILIKLEEVAVLLTRDSSGNVKHANLNIIDNSSYEQYKSLHLAEIDNFLQVSYEYYQRSKNILNAILQAILSSEPYPTILEPSALPQLEQCAKLKLFITQGQLTALTRLLVDSKLIEERPALQLGKFISKHFKLGKQDDLSISSAANKIGDPKGNSLDEVGDVLALLQDSYKNFYRKK